MDMNKWVNVLKISGNRFRQHVQKGLLYGLMQVKESDNSDALTTVIVACGELGIVSPKRLIDYVLTHTNGLEWKDTKFKKAEKGATVNVSIPTMEWWKFKAEKVPTDMVLMDDIKRIIKKAETAISEGRFKGEVSKLDELRKLAA